MVLRRRHRHETNRRNAAGQPQWRRASPGKGLFAGQEITLHRKLEGDQTKTVRARIVAEIDKEPDGFIYAVSILEPRADFWDIDFPAPQKGEEALARMLMECSFCQRREVVYLNEMEVKSFEIRRCVARLCRHCDSPSIWIEAQSDPKLEEYAQVVQRRGRTSYAAQKSHAREGPRACVHSAARISGRSGGLRGFIQGRHQFSQPESNIPEGTRLEVAVPYTPGVGRHFCADPHCVFAAHCVSGFVPPRRRVFDERLSSAKKLTQEFTTEAAEIRMSSRSMPRTSVLARIDLPVDDRVPQHALVTTIQIAMQAD